MRPDLSHILSVVATPDGHHERAQQFALANHLHFSLESKLSTSCDGLSPYILYYQASKVSIVQTQKGAPGPVSACLLNGKIAHRYKFGGGKSQLIAKAVGLKNGMMPSVLDATAGLGRDAFVLASLGCEVQLLERSPVIYELLSFALSTAQSSELGDVVSRMSLKNADATQWLTGKNNKVADVIYLDPMYPVREKTSLVKKEMRLFKELVGIDEDDNTLLKAALSKAEFRVVVKRPRKGVIIDGPSPSYQLNGKSSRFDIYTLKTMSELKQPSRT